MAVVKEKDIDNNTGKYDRPRWLRSTNTIAICIWDSDSDSDMSRFFGRGLSFCCYNVSWNQKINKPFFHSCGSVGAFPGPGNALVLPREWKNGYMLPAPRGGSPVCTAEFGLGAKLRHPGTGPRVFLSAAESPPRGLQHNIRPPHNITNCRT
jgi:hypothetical protein